jgi:hypothetical protein
MPVRRAGVSLAAAVIGLLVVLAGTGLLVGRPAGAEDNGDGGRLFCGAGLMPATPDHVSAWKSGVVVDFVREPPCDSPTPSSALVILKVATISSDDGWSLTRLAWLYAGLVAVVTAAAAWAASARSLWRTLVLVPGLVPLASADYSRFFLSTFSEPAGLLGAFALMSGVAAVTVTSRTDRSARLVALALVAIGGTIATTAKAGYAPVLVPACVVCAGTAVSLRGRSQTDAPRRTDRVVGPILALVTALLAAIPLTAALSWQTTTWGAINAHDLVYTTVLVEQPDAAAPLGLPPNAVDAAGRSFFPDGPAGVPGADVVAADPAGMRDKAVRQLAGHPAALARAIGVATQATEGASLRYLDAPVWTPADEPTPKDRRLDPGEVGDQRASLQSWLDSMALPWWPSLLTAIGVVLGGAGLVRRRAAWSPCARVAGFAAITSVGLTTAAVLGDGYFEIAKHVWLAAYLLEVTLVAIVGSAIVALAHAILSRRRTDLRPGSGVEGMHTSASPMPVTGRVHPRPGPAVPDLV